MAGVLRDDEWAQVVMIGEVERRLRADHESLRAIASGLGRAAELADGLRREIDVVLAEPDGPIAGTLREFPARDQRRAEGAVSRLERRGEELHRRAVELSQAVIAADAGRREVAALLESYQKILPASCHDLGLKALERRLDDVTTAADAARVRAAIRECGAMLAHRRDALVAEVERCRTALRGMGDQGAAVESSERDFERLASELRAATHRLAQRGVGAAGDAVTVAATAHSVFMETGRASSAFEAVEVRDANDPRPGLRARARQSALLAHWSALHRFQVRAGASPQVPTEAAVMASGQVSEMPGSGATSSDAGRTGGAAGRRRKKRVLKPDAVRKLARRKATQGGRELERTEDDVRPKQRGGGQIGAGEP